MKQNTICLFALFAVLLCVRDGQAQSTKERKFEIGAQVSVLPIADPRDPTGLPGAPLHRRTEVGFGGRFTYNLKRYLALEAEGNFFPRNYTAVRTDFTGGRLTQVLAGVKAGIRKERFGFFGKVRPGIVSSGGAVRANFPSGNGSDPSNPFGFETIRKNQLVLDVGGVAELYPTPRTLIRFDLGDTITRYPKIESFCFPAGVVCIADEYTHKPQFSAGVGFRF